VRLKAALSSWISLASELLERVALTEVVGIVLAVEMEAEALAVVAKLHCVP
jgi:nucleoside phosphorylase